MAFQYDTVEDEIVTRITVPLDSIAVVMPLPESEKQIQDAVSGAINSNKTLILIAYTGSDYGQPEALNIMRQNEDVKMLLNLQSNRLRGANGIYNVLSEVKRLLQGYQVAAFGSRLKLKSVDFDDRDIKMAMFSYNVIFTFSKLQVQAEPDDDDAITSPVLSQTYLIDEFTI